MGKRAREALAAAFGGFNDRHRQARIPVARQGFVGGEGQAL
jgi:hypothetical protein